MPVPKLRGGNIPDEMKPERKEGQDSLDTLIRQAVGKEPFLSFSRSGDSPVQWIQLLHSLDQQGTNKLSKGPNLENAIEGKELEQYNIGTSFSSEMNGIKEQFQSLKCSGPSIKGAKSTSDPIQSLKFPEAVFTFAQAAAKVNGEPEKCLPGWPLLSPPKAQMQKCDKCSREFCSPINYRRHIRVHRRSLNFDKDSCKSRDLLGAFWDKLPVNEAKELVSLKNVTIEEVAGSSIVRALTSIIRKPNFSSLPQPYVKAGVDLLDVVQARSSKLPLSSQDLFNILDDASEKTFLCVGTAVSIQKYVFDGDAGKIALEMKNLIACTSFLVEQKLVKAWVEDKDAEALRCQKLLVEEEEAAQKRQAELLERKRLKKLRQKVQKAKEQSNAVQVVVDFEEVASDSGVGTSFSAEASIPPPLFNTNNFSLPEPSSENIPTFVENAHSDGPDAGSHLRSGDSYLGATRASAGTHSDIRDQTQHRNDWRHLPAARRPVLKPIRNNIQNGVHLGLVPVSKSSTGPKKTASANGYKVWTRKTKIENQGEGSNPSAQSELGVQPNENEKSEVLIGSISVALGDGNTTDSPPSRQNYKQEATSNLDSSGLNVGTQPGGKFWRRIGRQEVGDSATLQGNKKEPDVDRVSQKGSATVEDGAPSGVRFSSQAAEAFLAQRWKVAIAADHIKLVIFPATEHSTCSTGSSSPTGTSPSPSGNTCECRVFKDVKKQLVSSGPLILVGATGGPKKTLVQVQGRNRLQSKICSEAEKRCVRK